MKILQAGTLSLAKWTARVECSNCGLVAEVTYTDIEYKDDTFIVPCPTDGCGIPMTLLATRLPRTVRNSVKLKSKNRN